MKTVSNITVSAEKESFAEGSVSKVSFLQEKKSIPNTIGKIKMVMRVFITFILFLMRANIPNILFEMVIIRNYEGNIIFLLDLYELKETILSFFLFLYNLIFIVALLMQ